jgi:hypothetical protein
VEERRTQVVNKLELPDTLDVDMMVVVVDKMVLVFHTNYHKVDYHSLLSLYVRVLDGIEVAHIQQMVEPNNHYTVVAHNHLVVQSMTHLVEHIDFHYNHHYTVHTEKQDSWTFSIV